MSDYLRTTRECKFEELEDALKTAVLAHIERYNLEGILETVLICCETTSTKQKKGLFRRKTEKILSGIILTSDWLIWVSGEEGDAAGTLFGRLHDLRIEDYEKTKMYDLIPESGLSIYGFHTGDGLGSVFFGLGPEPASQKLKDMLFDAQSA